MIRGVQIPKGPAEKNLRRAPFWGLTAGWIAA
jgi:hypothetical protein